MKTISDLTQIIEASKRQMKAKDILPLKSIDSEVLTTKMVIGLQYAVLQYRPYVNTAASVGRSILQGALGSETKESARRKAYFKAGNYLLSQLAKENIIKLKQTDGQYFIDIENQEVFDTLINSVDLELMNDQVHVLPQFKKPLAWNGFYNPIAGELIRGLNKDQQKYFTVSNCPAVFETVNRHQEVAWKINTDVLSVYKSIINKCKLFTLSDKVMDDNQKFSVKRANNRTLDLAEMVGDRTFWEYHYLDSRGRLYASTHYLNHGGSKLSKSLMVYNEKKPLGKSGWFFLLTHAASLEGHDKLDLGL